MIEWISPDFLGKRKGTLKRLLGGRIASKSLHRSREGLDLIKTVVCLGGDIMVKILLASISN